jgi:hypothetical protein
MINPKQDLWLGALAYLKQLGGTGRLQDIRLGAHGTTKGRAAGGKDVQGLAYELEELGLIKKLAHDTYSLTEKGNNYLEECKPVPPPQSN